MLWSMVFISLLLLIPFLTHSCAALREFALIASISTADAQAGSVDVRLRLSYGQLELRVSDNGAGRLPENWALGLGLGGVRKRTKQLGGQVTWLQLRPNGICCVVKVGDFVSQE